METLVIKKLNEAFMSIECEPSVERELSEHFCFFVPGYKFMPAYRNRNRPHEDCWFYRGTRA